MAEGRVKTEQRPLRRWKEAASYTQDTQENEQLSFRASISPPIYSRSLTLSPQNQARKRGRVQIVCIAEAAMGGKYPE